MYKLVLIIKAFLLVAHFAPCAGYGQDTSFTTFSAYNKALKQYPGIRVAVAVKLDSVAVESGIMYCMMGTRKLLLDVFYPANKQKINGIAVLIIHGGGWRSGSRQQHYPLAEQLASMGYTCFTPEYRLSGEALYPAAILDIKAAIKWIKSKSKLYAIDTSKIAALGFSAGGEMAAFAGATGNMNQFESLHCHAGFSSNIQAIIDIDGTLSFVHPESSEGNDAKKISAATQWLGVAKKDNFKLWEQASPLTHVGSHTAPTLFINSSVAAMHAGREDYIKRLKEHDIYSEVHQFYDSPHTFCLFHPWFEPTVAYIDGFLKKVFIKTKKPEQ